MEYPDKRMLMIELSYNAETMHGNELDGIEWFEKEILGNELILHSNILGDEVGRVRIIDTPLTLKRDVDTDK